MSSWSGVTVRPAVVSQLRKTVIASSAPSSPTCTNLVVSERSRPTITSCDATTDATNLQWGGSEAGNQASRCAPSAGDNISSESRKTKSGQLAVPLSRQLKKLISGSGSLGITSSGNEWWRLICWQRLLNSGTRLELSGDVPRNRMTVSGRLVASDSVHAPVYNRHVVTATINTLYLLTYLFTYHWDPLSLSRSVSCRSNL